MNDFTFYGDSWNQYLKSNVFAKLYFDIYTQNSLDFISHMCYTANQQEVIRKMNDSEKLDLIISELCGVKSDMSNMKSDIADLKDQMRKTQLHLENVTDRNIALLAENHCTLIDKLNQAIPVANKNLAYEVKVNYLLERVSLLEKDMADLKEKTA